MKVVGLAFAIFLTGCTGMQTSRQMLADMYNVPSSGASEFDGTKHIRVSNITCSGQVLIELYQDTDKAKDGVVLIKGGVGTVSNIGEGESLKFSVDEEKYGFEPIRNTTSYDRFRFDRGISSPFSNKPYLVSEDFIRDVALANRVVARVHLLDGTYRDGVCSEITVEEAMQMEAADPALVTQDGVDISNSVAATKGFRKFVKMMDSTDW